MIELTDDGTLDTVLRCSRCGKEMRYNYDPSEDEIAERIEHNRRQGQIFSRTNAEDDAHDAFVEWAIEDATDNHDCGQEDS